jgi:transcriptional regulator with XRE-family HTH domain
MIHHIDGDTTMKTWNERAREILRRQNVSIVELADRIGVTPGAAGHYLSGRRNPKPGMLRRIAEIAGVSVSELIEDDPSFARNQQEHEMLEALRQIPESRKDAALAMLKGLAIDTDSSDPENT